MTAFIENLLSDYITCANEYGISDKLKALGVNVDIMGAPLSNAWKAGDTSVLTF